MHHPTTEQWDQVRLLFQKIWGYSDFRPPQGEIVESLLSGHDALVVMPTGGGKSICFQLPALFNTGVTLVVSPLVALMENQVQELQQHRLPAAALHSELPPVRKKQILQQLQQQRLRLLYLSPETLLSESVWGVLCSSDLRINGIILDEAHCLVQWGETFRPAYYRLGAVRAALIKHKPANTQIPIAAFTATADPLAQQTIQQVLRLQQPKQFLLSPYRSNLHLAVKIAWTPRDRLQKLLRFVNAHATQSGLVYVRTRRDSETLASWFQARGFAVAAYHAGLGSEERRAIESAWLAGKNQFVICTSAFGMGINKPNVRWVAHYHAPTMLSEYVQEVGRAGRDGQRADALTLISEPTGWFDPGDKQRMQFFQARSHALRKTAHGLARQIPASGVVNDISRRFKDGAIALSLLHSEGQLEWIDPFCYRIHSRQGLNHQPGPDPSMSMMRYLHTRQCRWHFLLTAFGCGGQLGWRCGHCDRCQQPRYSRSLNEWLSLYFG